MKKLFTLVLAAFFAVGMTSAMIGCSGSTPAKKADEKKPEDKKPEDKKDK